MSLTRKQRKLAFISLSLFFVALIAILSISYKYSKSDDSTHYKAAVVANGHECAKIGGEILREGGSAADAAIATLFCEGVTCPQSMGLGGGFLLVIYDRKNKRAEYLNARETAPAASQENMYVGNPESGVTGGLAVAVPGELKGYWELHQKYGKLPWEQLVRPTIKLCREGHTVTPYLARIFAKQQSKIMAEPSLREIYVNPVSNETFKEGEKVKRLKLAASLEIIAREGEKALYHKNGSLLARFVADVRSFGGILTEEDMIDYKVEWEPLEGSHFASGKYNLFASPLPGSGPLLSYIFDILEHFKINSSVDSWQHIVEAFKFAYAERTKLGDPKFTVGVDKVLSYLRDPQYVDGIVKKMRQIPTSNDYLYYGANFSQLDDHGTAHVSVMAGNGDAVSVTSTINYIFGAMRRSQSTGIILNNEMNDFSTVGQKDAYGIPASPSNYIRPGKRPLSSMTPTIITDENNDVRIILGAAGGSKITLSLVNVILYHLYFNQSLSEAVEARRIYHLLSPMQVQYERGFNQTVLDHLSKIGHNLEENPPEFGFTAITSIARHDDEVTAVYDPRRGGSVDFI